MSESDAQATQRRLSAAKAELERKVHEKIKTLGWGKIELELNFNAGVCTSFLITDKLSGK